MTVVETIESAIEQMTNEAEAMKARVVQLNAGLEEHYAFLGRNFYNDLRKARETQTAATANAMTA